MGMRGRLICQSALLIVEGVMIFIFANTKSLAAAILLLWSSSPRLFSLRRGIYLWYCPLRQPTHYWINCWRSWCRRKRRCRLLRPWLPSNGYTLCVLPHGRLCPWIWNHWNPRCLYLYQRTQRAGLFAGQDSPEVIAAYKKNAAAAAATTLTVPEPDADAAKDVEADKEGSEGAEFNQFTEDASEKKITVEE